MRERLSMRLEPCLLPPLVGVEFGSGTEDETALFVLLPPLGGVVDVGRGVDTTLPPLPPFFPPLVVATGGSVEVELTGGAVSFWPCPPFPPLLAGEETAGGVEVTPGRVAVELTTELDEILLEAGGVVPVLFPLPETVIWRDTGYQHCPNQRTTSYFSRRPHR